MMGSRSRWKISHQLMFSDPWWRQWLDRSKGLVEAALIKNSVPTDLLSEQELMTALATIPRRHAPERPGIRVYVDGGEQARELVALYRDPVREGETLSHWVERSFGDRPFGLIINHAGKFLPQLRERLAPLYKGLIERLGVPWISLNATLIVGNYGYTPFGVHFDGEATSVIHFHLGPGTKKMTLWDPDTFVQLTGRRRHYCDPEKILPFGTTHEIEAGDTFYLPEGPFHIGNTPELSVALSVIIRGISVRDWLGSALGQQLERSFAAELMPYYDVDVPQLMAAGLVDPVRSSWSVERWVAEAMTDYRLALESNCGFDAEHPEPQELSEPFGCYLQVVRPFQIKSRTLDSNRTAFYFRGEKMVVTTSATEWLSGLNSGEILEADLVLQDHPELSDLLSQLVRYRAVKIVAADGAKTTPIGLAVAGARRSA